LQGLVDEVSRAEHYQRLSQRGLEYGPSFRGLVDISHGQDEALSRVRLPDVVPALRGQDRGLHPCMLDACLQGLAALLPGRETWVPSSIGRFRLAGRLSGDMEAWCHTRRRRDEPGDTTDELTGDVLAFDRDGRLLVEARILAWRADEVD
jgi:acyl transferase domain-containing protein